MTTKWLVCAIVCALLAPAMALAQVGTEGSFFGTVVDATGAVVPGAEVTAINLATGFMKTEAASREGEFNLRGLPPGAYSVSATASGFKKWELARVELSVGDRIRLSPSLEVGAISEKISVTAANELVQTENSAVATVVQMQQIRELPTAIRNPLALVALVPGMNYEGTQSGLERSTYIQGNGLRNNKTAFQLDGLNSNAPMDEGGTGVPNVDAVAEISVQSLNFSAESGRDPMQVVVVTKSGTNEFHGSLWEFVQNDKFNARNTFAVSKPAVRRNQFGASLGGPVIRNKTFFFGAFEGTRINNQTVYNSLGVTPAMKAGDFSALSKTIKDPYNNGAPFPGNKIPGSLFSGASKYFLPLILEPNSPDGFFRTNASSYDNTYEGTGRVDHFISPTQRIYGRYVTVREPILRLGYNPSKDLTGYDEVRQHNIGVNYNWTMSSRTLLIISFGRLSTNDSYTNPSLGKQNDVEKAGIQGIQTAGREAWIGPPNINFASGYTGVSFPGGWGVPGALWGTVYNGKASVSHIRGAHTLAAGFEYGDWHTFARHGSGNPRGTFNFSNLYTNDGFADYLLGLTSGSSRNVPRDKFGQDRAPYTGTYVNDSWRIRSNLTLDIGLRYERWYAHSNVKGAVGTWLPDRNLVVAGTVDGKVNLQAYPTISPYVAAASAGLWISAADANIPAGIYEPNGNWAPRVGVVYRPFSKSIVFRAAYGMFYNSYTGNRGASSVTIPFWSSESLSIGLSQLQRWETIWPAEPQAFTAFAIGEAAAWDIKPARTHEWNVSVQTELPFRSALTVSYVGTQLNNEIARDTYNAPIIGPHNNLQADRPIPRMGEVLLLHNMGSTWYHSLQTKLERRFSDGLTFGVGYTFSRSMMNNTPDCETCATLPFSPAWYNRGRTGFDRRQIEYATMVWQLPVGRGKHFLAGMNRVADAVLGGWQLSATQQAQSGSPLSVSGGTSNLGNGYGTRADIVGDPRIDNSSPALWFNKASFKTPALYTFGNSGIGVLEGPGMFFVNTCLAKNFHITEQKYFQFRWESFNTTNRVNYSNPNTTVTSSNFGKITSAGSARYMQFGLKFLF